MICRCKKVSFLATIKESSILDPNLKQKQQLLVSSQIKSKILEIKYPQLKIFYLLFTLTTFSLSKQKAE